MKKSLYKFAAFLATAATVTLLVTLPVRAQALVAMTNETVPVSLLAKPCSTNELVTFTGTLHRILMVSQTPSGHRLVHYLMQTDLRGVSSTGVEYHRSGINVGEVTLKDDLDVTVNTSVTVRLIAPGQEEDLLLHHIYHVTFYADGTIRSSHDYFSSECR